MTRDEFWAFIGETRRGIESLRLNQREGEQSRRYRALLEAMNPEQLVAFDRAFEERMREAYTWELWAAAYVMEGGCSYDGFRDFRAWLIAQGRERFEATLRDPESLADYPPLIAEEYADCPSYPDFWSIPWQVYHDQTGAEAFPNHGLGEPGPLAGEQCDDNEKSVQARHPRLFERFWPKH